MYESFENGDSICEEDIKLVQNYICGNLDSYLANRFYYYAQYNYVTKLLRKRERQFVTAN